MFCKDPGNRVHPIIRFEPFYRPISQPHLSTLITHHFISHPLAFAPSALAPRLHLSLLSSPLHQPPPAFARFHLRFSSRISRTGARSRFLFVQDYTSRFHRSTKILSPPLPSYKIHLSLHFLSSIQFVSSTSTLFRVLVQVSTNIRRVVELAPWIRSQCGMDTRRE